LTRLREAAGLWEGSGVRATILSVVGLLLFCSCADLGRYVWVRDYEAPAFERGFVIAPGDLLQVRVYNQDALATKVRVRPDGLVTLPLLGDVEASGYTPAMLAQQLESRYLQFLKQPLVTLSVEEVQPLQVPVAGEVLKQGIVSTDRQTGVLKVLLQAGGLTDFGHRDRIFVIRPGQPPARIRFTWDALTRGEPSASQFQLRSGDSLVVE
jgi:polysaccharide export outer membrane protein